MAKYIKPKWLDELKALAGKAHWLLDSSPEAVHLRNFLRRYKGFSQIRSYKIEHYGGSDYDVGGNITNVKIVDLYGQEWSFP